VPEAAPEVGTPEIEDDGRSAFTGQGDRRWCRDG
jgi:hypothetical protein